MAYIYQADVYCDQCGEHIAFEIGRDGKAPDDPWDESSFDSGNYPKEYCPEQQESDAPENCSKCGTFLENQLTNEGYRYLVEMLNRNGSNVGDAAKEWAEFYEFTYWQNPYESAHDWLMQVINDKAQASDANLVSMFRDLAMKVDGDTIQDLFQSDMDADDYFKESGWYSPEYDPIAA